MQWFVTNWFWVLIGIACVGMHLFGHGAHGAHGAHGGGEPARRNQDGDQEAPGRSASRNADGHQH